MFFKKIDERIKVLFIIIFLLFIVIIGRVFFIQVFDYKKLSEYAKDL
jgi:cell division protein FtsI/penicillin-binding protein 2